jgi:hypothetical protein
MAVEVAEMLVVAEAGGVPQGSPPHQAGEDRGTARPGETRRDGGAEAPAEDAASREDADRRVQADEGRGQEVHPTQR